MNADQLLAAYASRIQQTLGSDTTSTSELEAYGKRHFPADFFRGVYPAGQRPADNAGRFFFVINTTSSAPGEHWMAVAVQPDRRDMLFDSFGRRPSATWQPHLRDMTITDPDLNQDVRTNLCGPISLGFGMVFLHHGYDVAKLC